METTYCTQGRYRQWWCHYGLLFVGQSFLSFLLGNMYGCQFHYTRYVLNTSVTFTWHRQPFVHFYFNVWESDYTCRHMMATYSIPAQTLHVSWSHTQIGICRSYYFCSTYICIFKINSCFGCRERLWSMKDSIMLCGKHQRRFILSSLCCQVLCVCSGVA